MFGLMLIAKLTVLFIELVLLFSKLEGFLIPVFLHGGG